MNKEKALQVLVEAASLGQSRGIFTLEHAGIILQAINAFKPQQTVDNPAPVAEQVVEEPVVE